MSHKTPCHPSPQKQIGTPAQLREPARTPLLYSLPVTRSHRKTPESAKREEGGKNAVVFCGEAVPQAPCCPLKAQSTRRVYGVLRHVLANGSASFQSHPNHANNFRPNPADRAIPHIKDLRAETSSFGAFKPNMFTCARFFLISRARDRVWKGMCQLRLLAFAGMIGREGSSRLHHSDQEMGDPSVLERRLLGAAA